MGRTKKKIMDSTISLDKREYGYYSTPEYISEYIYTKLVGYNPLGQSVLDPCCGKEEMLKNFINNNYQVDGIDIVRYLPNYNINFTENDFFSIYSQYKENGELPLEYDFYVANPPYNCHELEYIQNNKEYLSQLFSDVGTYNMYSMFISAIIDMAKDGAHIGIITLDSFLTLNSHKKLRRKILNKCSLLELILCPTDLFLDQKADVRTCILILRKGNKYQGNIIVKNRPRSRQELIQYFQDNNPTSYSIQDITLSSKEDNDAFLIECPIEIINLFKNPRLGEKFKCVTGISTGNDLKYISDTRSDFHCVPFYKNPGNDRFYTDKVLYLHRDFLEYSETISNFIVRNKNILFQGGITCSSMGVNFTACLLPDNSTYGVNANIILGEDEKYWLLSYLNSKLVTFFVRGILIRSNMITSGYVSRIPIIQLSANDKIKLDELAKLAIEYRKLKYPIDSILDSVDRILFTASGLSLSSVEYITEFCNDLLKRT